MKVTKKRSRGRPNAISDQELMERLLPLIESGEFMDLPIKDICEKAEITTGIFYRRFHSKEDLLSQQYLKSLEEGLEEIKTLLPGKPLRERVLLTASKILECSALLGPDSVLVYMNLRDTPYDCEAVRDLARDAYVEAIEGSGEALSPGRTAQAVAKDLTILTKGLSYEWFTLQEGFSFYEEGMALIRRVLDSLL